MELPTRSASTALWPTPTYLPSGHWNGGNLASERRWTGQGDWKTDDKRWERDFLLVSTAVRSTGKGECGLIPKHVNYYAAEINSWLMLSAYVTSTKTLVILSRLQCCLFTDTDCSVRFSQRLCIPHRTLWRYTNVVLSVYRCVWCFSIIIIIIIIN